MDYYMPKGVRLQAAMEKGLIVPKNFLGKLECTRSLSKKEAFEWENYKISKAWEMNRCEKQKTL